MNAKELDSYLFGLGKSHSELVLEGVLPPGDFIEIYPEALSLYRKLQLGLELRFWAEDQNFEAIFISLAERETSKEIYPDKIPEPYSRCITREETLKVMGEPTESKGPHALPSPLGESGGWDKFNLPGGGRPELNVLFRYDVALNVISLVFALKRTGYDRDFDEAQHEEDV